MREFNFKKGGYLHFSNRKNAQWIYVLPLFSFHVVGTRDGRRELFPKKWEGIQINFTWLWFDIFYSSISDDAIWEFEDLW